MIENRVNKLLTLSDKHKNQPALICGLGPSLLKLNKEEYKNNIIIVCNEFHKVPNFFNEEFKPHFWCAVNQASLIKNELKYCEKCKIENAVFSVGSDQDKPIINSIINTNKDNINCFYWDLDERELQEIIKNKFNTQTIYSKGATIIVHMIALALLLGCNPISITGFDLGKSGKTNHAGFNNEDYKENETFQSHYEKSCIKHDLFYFSLLIKKWNIDIYNLSHKINNIPYFKTKD